MNFSRETYQNRYLWTMQDMARAGMNPMLAYQQGVGSSPGGAQYQARDIISPAVSSAQAARRLNAEIDNIESQTKKNRADAQLATQKDMTELALQSKIDADAALANQNRLIGQQTMWSAKAQAEGAKHEIDMYNTPYAGQLIKWADMIRRALGGSSHIGVSRSTTQRR